MTTTHDAQRAMKIFFKSELDEHDRKEWFAITGQYDLTTKVLWDTIRASESVAGFSGLGAAAQEPKGCPNCAEWEKAAEWAAKQPEVPAIDWKARYEALEAEVAGMEMEERMARIDEAAQEQPVESHPKTATRMRDGKPVEIQNDPDVIHPKHPGPDCGEKDYPRPPKKGKGASHERFENTERL